MTIKKILIILCLYSTQVFSQTTFEKTYSLFDGPQAYFVQPLKDGGYVVCGQCQNVSDSTSDFCFFKTNEYGNVIWSKQLNDTTIMGGYPTNEWATTIREKPDGTFIFGGSVKDPDYSYSEAFYGWLNSDGSMLNSTSRSTSWTTSVNALLLNNDGSIVSTRDDREGAGHYANFLEINSATGDLLAGASAGNYSISNQALVKMPDGGYATLAIEEAYYFEPPYEYLPVVSRFDQDGNVTRRYVIHNEIYLSDSLYTSLCATPDNGLLICGYVVSGNMFVTKFNSDGDSLWSKSFSVYGIPSSIQQTSDGGYAISGTLNNKLMLMKMNADVDSVWINTYSNPSANCKGIYFQQTADNGFIILGQVEDSGSEKIYLVKTDSNGNTNTITKTEKADPAKTFNLYPDPFSSTINVNLPGNSSCVFSLRDVSGRIVFSKKIFTETERLDLSFLPAGIYFASVPGDGFIKSGILMKQ